ncbi:MAG: hypothetical protein M1150_03780 [Patescibacteria group bacterium]|nr:hypothetical protein [Patescibacteria group bacterium]
MFKKVVSALVISLSSILLTHKANAQGIINLGNVEATSPKSFTDLGQLLTVLLQAVIILGGLLFFIYLLVGGLQWITSGGDKASLESARNRITNALIGLVILVGAFSIIKIIETVFGISIISGIKIPGP